MNFIVSSLLFSIAKNDLSNIKEEEEHTFWIFVSIMEKKKLKEFFLDMNKMCEFLEILDITI